MKDLRIESGPADTVNSSFYQDMLKVLMFFCRTLVQSLPFLPFTEHFGLLKNEHIAVGSVVAWLVLVGTSVWSTILGIMMTN